MNQDMNTATVIPLRSRRDRRSLVPAGAIAGMIAGLALLLAAMITFAIAGLGFWLPPKLIAGIALGVEVIIGGTGTVLLGLLIHLIVSAALGVGFATLTGEARTLRQVAFSGLAYGIGVWAVMTFVALPIVNPTMGERVALFPVSWFIQHLIFGLVLSITPALNRRMGGRTVAETSAYEEDTRVEIHRAA